MGAAEPAVPAEFRRELARDYHDNAGRALLRGAAVGEILGAFAGAGVESIALKGIALAEAVYGDPALRPMNDVDLLVRREQIPEACAALATLGYEPPGSFADDRRRRAASVFFARTARSMRPPLDLHWALVEDRYGGAAHRWPGGIWQRTGEVTVAGRPVRALAPTDAVIHACVHLAGNHGLGGLLWLCDLAGMSRVWGGAIDWDELVERVHEAGMRGMVYAALRCAAALVGADVPALVLDRLRPPAPRTRGFLRLFIPVARRLPAAPFQDYIVPLLLLDRGRDVARAVARRLTAT